MPSFSSLIQEKNVSSGFLPIERAATDFSDIVSASFDFTQSNFNFDAKTNLNREIRNENNITFEEQFGDSIENSLPEPTRAQKRQFARSSTAKQNYIDEQILIARKTDPEKFGNALTSKEIEEESRKRANFDREELESIERNTSVGDIGSFTASFLGSIGAAFTDPINVATLPLGAGRTFATSGYRSILRAAMIDGAINAGVEITSAPFIADWQKELGQEYGFSDFVTNVAAAGLFGTAFSGVTRSAKPLTSVALSKVADLPGMTRKSRLAAKELSEEAQLKESNPVKNQNAENFQKHSESIDNVENAFQTGRMLNENDIKNSTLDLLSQDEVFIRNVADEISQLGVQVTDNSIFEKLTSEISKSLPDINPKFFTSERIKTITNKIEELTRTANNIDAFKDFTKRKSFLRTIEDYSIIGEKQLIDDALYSIKPEQRKIIQQVENLKKVLENRKKGAQQLKDMEDLKNRIVPKNYRQLFDSVKNAIRSNKNINLQLDDLPKVEKFLNENGIEQPKINSLKQADEVFEQINSKEYDDALEAEFARLKKDDPNFVLVTEEGEISIKNLTKELEADEKIVSAVQTCGIGK